MVRFGRGRGTQQDTTGYSGNSAGGRVGAGKILSAVSALLIPLWILAGGAWIVQVVGLGLCQHTLTNGSHFLQFDWFVTSLEVVVLLLVPFPLIARRGSPGLVALLAVVTVLEILRTNVWNDARLSQGDINGVTRNQIDSVINPGLNASAKRVQTTFAGYLMVSALNCLLLLGLGALPAPSAQDARHVEHNARVAAADHKSDNYNGTTGTMNNQPGVHNGVGSGVHSGVGHHNGVGPGGAVHSGAGQV